MKPSPPSLPQLRQSLQRALATERDRQKRAELGRAIAALQRCESVDKKPKPC